MSSTWSRSMAYIQEEISKVKGVSLPARSSVLERAVRRKLPVKKLHPNPYDEFCDPKIGPNEGIVRQYVETFRRLMVNGGISYDAQKASFITLEPICVQKIRPEGYMILNGHHRWLAALQAGIPEIPVRIVNLTQKKDLERMISGAKYDRRVTMDLDEVVFTPGPDGKKEKALPFPLNRIYRQDLRYGIPALISFLTREGYDLWLYSAGYYSQDYVERLLKHHHVKVTGVITGIARKDPAVSEAKEEVEQLFRKTYRQTIHLDQATMLCVDHTGRTFSEIPLDENKVWAAEIINLIKEGAADE